MPVNYDNSAWFYDALSRVVYGDAIVNAHLFLLKCIPPAANVLIVGGGTGWILEKMTTVCPGALTITYVESSAQMIALSKKKDTGNNTVTFINDRIERVDLPSAFDVVITAFLFDNFSEETLSTIFSKVDSLLKDGGTWLYADFQLTGRWWQPLLLKTMLTFFKLLCGIEASRLPDVASQFKQYLYTQTAHKMFFGDFITAQVLKKPMPSIPGKQTYNQRP